MKTMVRKELVVTQRNEVGVGAEIFGVLSDLEINVRAFSAWVEGPQAHFTIIVDDEADIAKQALLNFGYDVDSREVLLLELPNQPGALVMVLQKMAVADIDVEKAYASGLDQATTPVVLRPADIEAAIRELADLGL